MKKQLKKHSPPVEHYFIPLGLVLLNICLIHFLFVLSSGGVYTAIYKLSVGAALLALTASIAGKRSWSILAACLFYLCLLSGLLNPLLA